MFDIVIISLKNHHYLSKSRNFRSPTSKERRRWWRRAPALSNFLKSTVTKIMHFRHISAKIHPKILNLFILINARQRFDWGGALWLRPWLSLLQYTQLI